MSLRRRLLLGILVLTGVGFVITDIATHSLLSSYLYGQVDSQLASTQSSVIGHDLCQHLQPQPPGCSRYFTGGPPTSGLTGTYWSVINTSDGSSYLAGCFLPAQFRCGQGPAVPSGLWTGGGPVTTGSYRMDAENLSSVFAHLGLPLDTSVTFQEPQGPVTVPATDLSLVVAIPMSGVSSTLARLSLIELLVTIAVLVLLAIVATAIVRLGLRPVEQMTETASLIASGGDLSRRVAVGDERTEVGRLATALNTMLAQIEAAFDARERSEWRLRRFVADASHELRTPLTSIRGYAELFRRGANRRPEDLSTAMRRIEEEATRMGVLVDDLLLLARLDQGPPVEKARVDLAKVAADAVSDFRAVDPDRPIDLEVEPTVVLADEGRLRQVAANLLANVRQHTAAGTAAHVSVFSEARPAGLDGATDGVSASDLVGILEVADEGAGMSEEQLAHVFERFYRADPGRARASGGAGLGLSIVAAIAAGYGGRATVESVPGVGTRFRVEFPLAELPPSAADSPEVEASWAEPQQQSADAASSVDPTPTPTSPTPPASGGGEQPPEKRALVAVPTAEADGGNGRVDR